MTQTVQLVFLGYKEQIRSSHLKKKLQCTPCHVNWCLTKYWLNEWNRKEGNKKAKGKNVLN